MAEELYTIPGQKPNLSNEIIVDLWNRNAEWVEYFPEAFWALEQIKVAVDLHTRLLERYDKGSPYKQQQIQSVNSLYEHHIDTGLAEIIRETMPVIFEHTYQGKT